MAKKSNSTKEQATLRRYTLGFGLLMLILVLGAVIYFVRTAPARADNVQAQRITDTSNAVGDYYRSRVQQLPNSLSEVYQKAPPRGIDYTKLTASIYMLCTEFNQQRGGYGTRYDRYEAKPNNAQLAQALEAQKAKDPAGNYQLVINGYFDDYSYAATVGKNCYIFAVSQY